MGMWIAPERYQALRRSARERDQRYGELGDPSLWLRAQLKCSIVVENDCDPTTRARIYPSPDRHPGRRGRSRRVDPIAVDLGGR